MRNYLTMRETLSTYLSIYHLPSLFIYHLVSSIYLSIAYLSASICNLPYLSCLSLYIYIDIKSHLTYISLSTICIYHLFIYLTNIYHNYQPTTYLYFYLSTIYI